MTCRRFCSVLAQSPPRPLACRLTDPHLLAAVLVADPHLQTLLDRSESLRSDLLVRRSVQACLLSASHPSLCCRVVCGLPSLRRVAR
jgi:hypothetical protein